tara:strand:- start:3180 stop:3524 length:345 start_codon:yes stop_codon:yes gene_type:complete
MGVPEYISPNTLDMTPEERKEYRKKIQLIAEKCVWYTSVNWGEYKLYKKRTSFHQLNKYHKAWYIMVAENGLEYCTKWKFNPAVPYIINTVVYPAYLFSDKPKEEKRRKNYDKR